MQDPALLASAREKRFLRRKLDPLELQRRQQEVVDITHEIAIEESELKDYSSMKRNEIKELRKKRNSILDLARTGYSEEHVDCYVVLDHEKNIAEYYEVSTGEIVDQRRLAPDERQTNILKQTYSED